MTDESATLIPDRVIDINGVSITVSPFKGKQIREIGPLLPSVIKAMDDVIGDGSDISGLFDELSCYPEHLSRMVELSTGMDSDFVDELSGSDYNRLHMAFFEVNVPFFTERIAIRRQLAKAAH